jgi:hypothetical protein
VYRAGRQALDRWELAPDRTSNPAYFLLFLSDQLREYSTPLQDTTVVPAAPATLIGIFILDSATDLDLISGGTLIGTLDRTNGGVVAALSMAVDALTPVADAILATLNQPASVWEPPGYDTKEPQAAYAFLELDGVHGQTVERLLDVQPGKGLPKVRLLCRCGCRRDVVEGRKFANQDHYSVWLSRERFVGRHRTRVGDEDALPL